MQNTQQNALQMYLTENVTAATNDWRLFWMVTGFRRSCDCIKILVQLIF